jgi:hypothetical protein
MRKTNNAFVLLFFGLLVLTVSCAHIKENRGDNSMIVNLDLSRDDELVYVTAHILFGASFSGNFSFSVGQSMNIESVYASGSECKFETIGVNDPFRQMNKVSIDIPHKSTEIWVRYSGKPEGYHVFNNNKIFAVNIYSAWYPDEISLGKADIKVRFHDAYYTYVVNAHYNKTEQVWEYRPGDMDCNILAYKDPKLLQNDFVDLVCVDGNDDLANIYFEA